MLKHNSRQACELIETVQSYVLFLYAVEKGWHGKAHCPPHIQMQIWNQCSSGIKLREKDS